MQQAAQTCCSGGCSWREPSPCPEAHTIFTQSTAEHPRLTHQVTASVRYVCLQSVHVHVCTVSEYRTSQICFWHFCVCACCNMGGTVDTALLRRRLGVLLWADIRASMSSSASSSENSCGWQHSHLIKREMASGKWAKRRRTLHGFPQSSAVWVGFHKFNQTSQDRA